MLPGWGSPAAWCCYGSSAQFAVHSLLQNNHWAHAWDGFHMWPMSRRSSKSFKFHGYGSPCAGLNHWNTLHKIQENKFNFLALIILFVVRLVRGPAPSDSTPCSAAQAHGCIWGTVLETHAIVRNGVWASMRAWSQVGHEVSAMIILRKIQWQWLGVFGKGCYCTKVNSIEYKKNYIFFWASILYQTGARTQPPKKF